MNKSDIDKKWENLKIEKEMEILEGWNIVADYKGDRYYLNKKTGESKIMRSENKTVQISTTHSSSSSIVSSEIVTEKDTSELQAIFLQPSSHKNENLLDLQTESEKGIEAIFDSPPNTDSISKIEMNKRATIIVLPGEKDGIYQKNLELEAKNLELQMQVDKLIKEMDTLKKGITISVF